MVSPPTRPARRRRTFLRRMLWSVLAVGTVAALALPWWLPAMVVLIAGNFDARIGTWSPRGWSATEYRDIVYESGAVKVSVDSAIMPLFGVAPSAPASEGPSVLIGNIHVVIEERERPSEAEPLSMVEIVNVIEKTWASLVQWLPPARIEQVQVETSGERYVLRELVWDSKSVRGVVSVPGREITGPFVLEAASAMRWRLSLEAPAQSASATLEIEKRAEGGPLARGMVVWRENSATAEAEFGPDGLMPVRASLAGNELRVPADQLGLQGYEPVTGAVRLQWRDRSYAVSLSARARPREDTSWPELTVDVRATGDVERVRVDAVNVTMPGLQAALSQPLEWRFSGTQGPVEAATFSIEAQLADIPGLAMSGSATGQVHVEPGVDGSAPEVAFQLAGAEVAWRELKGATLQLTGRWKQPELAIESAVLEVGGDRSEGSGRIDLVAQAVREAQIRARVSQSLLSAFWPEAPKVERIEMEAAADGPFSSLAHRGSLNLVGWQWTQDRPLGGAIKWTGMGTSAAITGELALPGGGSLPFDVDAQRSGDGSVAVRVDAVRWVDAQGEWWRLQEPSDVVFSPADGSVRLSSARLAGDGLELTADAAVIWPAVGEVNFSISGLEGGRFGGALPEAVRGGRIEQLKLHAAWDHGPVKIDGHARAKYSPTPDTDYSVEGEFVTQDKRLAFGSLTVADASGAVLRGVGHLPLTISGTDAGLEFQFSRDREVSLDLASEPNPLFWKSLADLTGWTIEEPKLACRLAGSVAKPRGEFEFSATTLRPPDIKLSNGGKLPALAGLYVKLTADDAGLSIAQSMVAIDDRWVTLKGNAPWSVWTHWRETGEIDWRRGAFDLASNPLPIAIASRVFPTELAPEGEVSIKIAHDTSAGLSGRIWLHGAALRPVGQLGSVREIHSELDFEGYRMVLTRLEGLLGGQAMKVSGMADITDLERPQYELHVESSRVPLVRRAGLIVRAELDLHLKQGTAGPAEVTGRMDFGPSLYSADLISLLPTGGVETPESRPPYFSIEEKPFADWKLDVAVHGESFLRITTPFYRDLLSTDVTLAGTLAEPTVVGWVWGSGGSVIFPFGRIAAEEVLVTLTRENPFEPSLVVSGGGRVLGYDVRMEASGSASDPRLIFTSDPPLTSQQVFLMLTTGFVPDNGTGTVSDRASRIAFFIGRNLVSTLGLRDEERLSIRSGENFTREGRETVYVQYDLNGRWSIVGEYDRFDAYNGGLKFRLVDR